MDKDAAAKPLDEPADELEEPQEAATEAAGPAEDLTEPQEPDVAHRVVEATVELSGTPRTGELLVGEFPGSIDKVETGDGAEFDEVHLEEAAVGVTRVRVTSRALPEGETAVRLHVVA